MSVISNIIVGIDHWDDITKPFMNSIREHEQTTPILIIDNASRVPYPVLDDITTIRTTDRLGYAAALNVGIQHFKADWYVCFNNDCQCRGKYVNIIDQLDPNILYGSKWTEDDITHKRWTESAWLIISKKILKKVGLFDPLFDAGFEELDYELRAEEAGFKLGVAELPIIHLARSTRFDEPNYCARWNKCREYFAEKHSYTT